MTALPRFSSSGRAFPSAVPPTQAPVPLAAATLFAGCKEVVITHAGELYRLRLTRQNKLILTK
jgi:hemin uptake protein HemP